VTAVDRTSTLPDLEPRRYVGESVLRVEDLPLLRGEASFVDDVERPGLVYARVVRSQVAHGLVRAVDVRDALRNPSVVAAVTAADLPRDVRVPIRILPTPLAERALQPVLAREVVRYVGEPVAVVVATSAYEAEDAAEEVQVEIDPLPAALGAAEAVEPGAPLVHEEVAENVADSARLRHGAEIDELFRRADVVVGRRLAIHRHGSVPLETRGLVAEFDRETGRLTVWGATKVKHFNRRVLAEMLGLAVERVRLLEPDVGGGFGTRGEFYPEDFLIPWLAMATGRPVKWIEDRQEHFVAANQAREQECVLEVAATSDGRLLAFRATAWVDLGAYVRTNALVLAKNTVVHLPGPYRWEGFEAEAVGVLTHRTPIGTYRGPAQFEPAFHRERVLDVVAREVGLDPVEFRRRNLIRREQMPYALEFEGDEQPVVYDSGDFPYLWERLTDHVSYARLRCDALVSREKGERVGIGTAAFVEAGGIDPYEWARIVPEQDGTFTVHVGIAALGQGIRTALSQIAADALQVPIENVRVSHADTDRVLEGGGSFASRSVVFGGNAVLGAAADLLDKARTAGGEALGVAREDAEVIPGGLVRARGGGRALPLEGLGVEGDYRFEKHVRSFSMGAALAVVKLDPETGGVSVERCVLACDVGRVINPVLVDAQLVGAAAQGIAGVLLEEFAYDSEGQPLATSFMDYCMPTAAELPRIETIVLELPQHRAESSTPLGAKGAGEGGIVGIGAAVANAVADAADERGAAVDRLPLKPEVVRSLFQEQ
jgi:carbon-monoxide dehydrogenase large subunit